MFLGAYCYTPLWLRTWRWLPPALGTSGFRSPEPEMLSTYSARTPLASDRRSLEFSRPGKDKVKRAMKSNKFYMYETR